MTRYHIVAILSVVAMFVIMVLTVISLNLKAPDLGLTNNNKNNNILTSGVQPVHDARFFYFQCMEDAAETHYNGKTMMDWIPICEGEAHHNYNPATDTLLG
jgi:hypothetical protein